MKSLGHIPGLLYLISSHICSSNKSQHLFIDQRLALLATPYLLSSTTLKQ